MKKYITDIKKKVSTLITDELQLLQITEYIRATVEKQLAVLLLLSLKHAIPLLRFQTVNLKKKLYLKLLNLYKSKFKPLDIQLLTALRLKVATMLKQHYLQLSSKWNEAYKYFNVDEKHKDYLRRSKLAARFAKTNELKKLLTLEELNKNLEIYLILKDAGSITENQEILKTQSLPNDKPIKPTNVNLNKSRSLLVRLIRLGI